MCSLHAIGVIQRHGNDTTRLCLSNLTDEIDFIHGDMSEQQHSTHKISLKNLMRNKNELLMTPTTKKKQRQQHQLKLYRCKYYLDEDKASSREFQCYFTSYRGQTSEFQ